MKPLAACAAMLVLLLACGEREPESSGPPLDVATLDMRFVRIPAGSFDMGSDSKRSFDQNPVHRVTISRPFELQTTEVTQAQWTAVMGTNPSRFRGDDLPVEQVSWNEAQELIRRLNERDPGRNYRLPTEAEWEYACRAGTDEARFGDIDAIAWYDANAGDRTHPVGGKQPNAWGLHDMLGNVWELCADWKAPYPAGPVTDPAGPPAGYYKVCRGGSWFDVRSAVTARFRASPGPDERAHNRGFRLARDVGEE